MKGLGMYDVGGEIIPTKAAMTRRCQAIMEKAVTSKPFRSRVLTDLVAKYHYFCPLFGLVPDIFRKDPPRLGFTGYSLMGHFDIPTNQGWHGVSWRKCINHPTFESEVKSGFRNLIQIDMNRRKTKACTQCGSLDNLEVDHVAPTFGDIMLLVLPIFTDQERETWLGFDWRHAEAFTLPVGHPALTKFKELHASAEIQTLCKSCHAKRRNTL